MKSIDTYLIAGRLKKKLPVLRENRNNRKQYDPEAKQGPPLGIGDHCVLCGWEPCHCEHHQHNESEID